MDAAAAPQDAFAFGSASPTFFQQRGGNDDGLCRMRAVNNLIGEQAYVDAKEWLTTMGMMGQLRGYQALWEDTDMVLDGGEMPIGLAVERKRPWWVTVALAGSSLAAVLSRIPAASLLDPFLRRCVLFDGAHTYACRGDKHGHWYAIDRNHAPTRIADSDQALLSSRRFEEAGRSHIAGVVFVARTEFAQSRWLPAFEEYVRAQRQSPQPRHPSPLPAIIKRLVNRFGGKESGELPTLPQSEHLPTPPSGSPPILPGDRDESRCAAKGSPPDNEVVDSAPTPSPPDDEVVDSGSPPSAAKGGAGTPSAAKGSPPTPEETPLRSTTRHLTLSHRSCTVRPFPGFRANKVLIIRGAAAAGGGGVEMDKPKVAQASPQVAQVPRLCPQQERVRQQAARQAEQILNRARQFQASQDEEPGGAQETFARRPVSIPAPRTRSMFGVTYVANGPVRVAPTFAMPPPPPSRPPITLQGNENQVMQQLAAVRELDEILRMEKVARGVLDMGHARERGSEVAKQQRADPIAQRQMMAARRVAHLRSMQGAASQRGAGLEQRGTRPSLTEVSQFHHPHARLMTQLASRLPTDVVSAMAPGDRRLLGDGGIPGHEEMLGPHQRRWAVEKRRDYRQREKATRKKFY